MNLLLAVVSMILVVAVGDLAYRVLQSRYGHAISPSVRWPLAFAFGVGASVLLVFYASLISSSRAFMLTYGIFFILSVTYLLVSAYIRLKREINYGRFLGAVILIVLSLSLVAFLWYVSGRAGPGYDSYFHWGIKAKAGFLDGGWILTEAGLGRFAHSGYPLLVPTIQAWVYTLLGQVDAEAVKIVFVLFYLALGGLFYHAAWQSLNKILSAFFTLLMMSTPLLSISSLTAYADVPLTFYLFGTIFFLTQWLENRRAENLLIGAVLAGLMLLVKRESVVYWMIIFLFITGTYLLSRRKNHVPITTRQALVLPAAAILIAGSWFILIQITGVESGEFETPSLSLLLGQSERLVVIIEKLLSELFLNFGAWGILWYLFVITTIWKWRRLSGSALLLLWISVVLPIVLLSFSFAFSAWDDYTIHLESALNRLIIPTVPLAWLFIAKQSSELQAWFHELRYGVEIEPMGTET